MGALLAAATFFPVNSLDGREVVDLSGTWRFRIDPEDVGLKQNWQTGAEPFPREITVPGAWNTQGVEFETSRQLHQYIARPVDGHLLGPGPESEKLFHVYPGPGWYRRVVRVPGTWNGKSIWLNFGGVHRSADVWINGRHLGTHVGYVVPFRYDVTDYVKPGFETIITVRVDARRNRDIDPLMGCMDTLDFLYVTWGGIYRGVELEATADTWIDDVFVVPRVGQRSAEVRVTPGKTADSRRRQGLRVRVEIIDAEGRAVAQGIEPVSGLEGPTTVSIRIPQAKLWSPGQPYLYGARVTLMEGENPLDRTSVRFGMREFSVKGGKFLLNGEPIFLRGYGDDCIYPNTIALPADPQVYRKRFRVAKEYGFNYARHHSWIPPKEYLDVADEMGMLLQPEFPFAYRWDLPKTPEAKRRAIELWREVIKANRNHPSIVVWCMGNELYDSFDQAPEMYRLAKQLDPTRPVIDSDGVSRNPRPTLDFWVWQFGESGSCGFKDGKYRFAPHSVPIVAHEMGYFVTLPDLTQLPLFGRGLRPYWLYEAEQNAKKQGATGAGPVAPLKRYARWVDRSNRLQAACLKTNIEAARRSALQGYHVWLFQDYPWCAEGVVDMFYRPKAIRGEAFRKFNAPTVLLIAQDQRSYCFGEKAEIPIYVSRYEQKATHGATLRWELRAEQETIAAGTHENLEVPCGRLKQLPTISLEMPTRHQAQRLQLVVALADAHGTVTNDWDFWVFPKERLKSGKPGTDQRLVVAGTQWLRAAYPWAVATWATGAAPAPPAPDASEVDLLLTDQLCARVLAYLKAGGRVLLLDPRPAFPTVTSNYRPSGWDPGSREAHLGTIFDPQHPAMRGMPSDGWCDLQFYDLANGASTVLLGEVPGRLEPIVRVIDMPQRLWDKALLFEARVGQGRLLVSGFRFEAALKASDRAALYFLDELVRYALGPDFRPAGTIPLEYFAARPHVEGK